VLGLHAIALAAFALVIAGGAGALATPLVGLGFTLVGASYVVARRRPAAPEASYRVTPGVLTVPAERAGEMSRASA
jgi:hypothetical protein